MRTDHERAAAIAFATDDGDYDDEAPPPAARPFPLLEIDRVMPALLIASIVAAAILCFWSGFSWGAR